jgi:hypothetical protein
VEDFELGVLHPVQQHVHARQVVGGDVLSPARTILPMPCGPMRLRTFSSSEPEPQAKSITLSSRWLHARAGLLAVQRDDGGKNVGDLLRRIELARLLARARGKLANQVLIRVAQRVHVPGKPGQPLGNLLDDGAELGIALGVVLAELFEARSISENKP